SIAVAGASTSQRRSHTRPASTRPSTSTATAPHTTADVAPLAMGPPTIHSRAVGMRSATIDAPSADRPPSRIRGKSFLANGARRIRARWSGRRGEAPEVSGSDISASRIGSRSRNTAALQPRAWLEGCCCRSAGSVEEVALSREVHADAARLRELDRLLVADGSARLDDDLHARVHERLGPVGEGEERVGGRDGALHAVARALDRKAARVDA